MRKLLLLSAVSIIPLLFLLAGAGKVHQLGDVCLSGRYDPSYAYLFNGLNILSGTPPAHTDHPGTPVQLISASVIFMAAQLGGSTLYDIFTIEHAESCLRMIILSLLTLIVVALAVLGVVIVRTTRSVLLALAMQLTPFMCWNIVCSKSFDVAPEPLMYTIGYAMLACLIIICANDSSPRSWTFALIGIVAGIGMATKFTFLPLLLVPVFLFRRAMHVIAYTVAVPVGFILFTIPIISKYQRVFKWLFNARRTTNYLSQAFWQNAEAAFCLSPAFYVSAGVGVVVLLLCLVAPYSRVRMSREPYVRLLCGLLFAVAITPIMVANRCVCSHYMTTAAVLPGAILITSALTLQNVLLKKDQRLFTQLARGAMVLIAVCLSWTGIRAGISNIPTSFARVMARNTSVSMHEAPIISNVWARGGAVLYDGRYAKSYLWSLYFGNWWSGFAHSGTLAQKLPYVYFYQPWLSKNRHYGNWKGFQTYTSIVRKHTNIVFITAKEDMTPIQQTQYSHTLETIRMSSALNAVICRYSIPSIYTNVSSVPLQNRKASNTRLQ